MTISLLLVTMGNAFSLKGVCEKKFDIGKTLEALQKILKITYSFFMEKHLVCS